MSTNSNDPFNNPNAAPAPHQGQVTYAQPPQQKSRTGLLIGCGIAGVLGLLVCCGGISMLGFFGMGAVAQLLQAEIENSPTVIEHFGQIESMSMNLGATGNEAQNVQPGSGSPLVFDVQGSKGSGQVVIVQSSDGQGVSSAVLITDDGTRYPVELTGGNDFEEVDMELDDLIESGTVEE